MLTAERVRELMDYDPQTGEFTWKVTSGKARKGAKAGSVGVWGYLLICLRGRPWPAHRLAWLHVHGEWPKGQIDHINGVRTDNRLANLRDVSQSVNMQNQRKATKRSSTGILGVYVAGPGFMVRLQKNRKMHYIGFFMSKEEAEEAYVQAKRKLHEGCTI